MNGYLKLPVCSVYIKWISMSEACAQRLYFNETAGEPEIEWNRITVATHTSYMTSLNSKRRIWVSSSTSSRMRWERSLISLRICGVRRASEPPSSSFTSEPAARSTAAAADALSKLCSCHTSNWLLRWSAGTIICKSKCKWVQWREQLQLQTSYV